MRILVDRFIYRGFAMRQGDTPHLVSPNARPLHDQDEKRSLVTSRIQLSRILFGPSWDQDNRRRSAQCGRALSRELAPSGGVENRLDQQADITVVDGEGGVRW